MDAQSGSQALSNVVAGSSSTSNVDNRPPTGIWCHFTKDFTENSRHVQCNYCGSRYTFPKNSGTGTLNRHMKNKHPDIGNTTSQSQISKNLGGNFHYTDETNRNELSRFIVAQEIPFTFGESQYFTHYAQTALNPAYGPVSRNTVKSRITMHYNTLKELLINQFANGHFRISLTSDLWTSRQQTPYICVTAHWVDNDWILQKRIISFKVLEWPHTGVNIFNAISSILAEYTITKKIFSVSFDNASNNNRTVELLSQLCEPILYGELFHVRCACHILHLCVTDGLKHMIFSLQNIRNAILFITTSSSRRQHYKALCNMLGVPKRQLKLDTPTRWNSTYAMLKTAYPARAVINQIWNEMGTGAVSDEARLDDITWTLVHSSILFLQRFKIATERFSRTYSPTSHLILPELLEISFLLTEKENDIFFQHVVRPMREKLDKYFKRLPMIVCLAPIFDPRNKSIINEMIESWHLQMGHTDVNISKEQTEVLKCLNDMFNLYASQHTTTDTTQGTSSSDASNWRSRLKKQKFASSNLNELSIYLNNQHIGIDDNVDFDILAWWKENEKLYPILSTMARDILTAPMSTVASESAFSAGGRILSARRSSMKPKTCEVAICTKDWIAAEERTQHLISLDEDDKNEFEDSDSATSTSTTQTDQVTEYETAPEEED